MFFIRIHARPFYGYHRKEHKYMKIFLYNPAFIRRTANLLQNGAILSRIFQPHESHVPFILQFMIDFNLYGMSCLYAPLNIIKYRQNTFQDGHNVDISTIDIKHPTQQLLEPKIERMSTSKQEIDLNAGFILNRFQVSIKNDANEHANPGIAFIWNDERGRRNKMTGEVSNIFFAKFP